MKEIISEERYQEVLRELADIENERKLLEKANLHSDSEVHVPLATTFAELILNIRRENLFLDSEIKRAKLTFLKNFRESKHLYYTIESKIDILVEMMEQYENNEEAREAIPTICNEQGFEVFYGNVQNLISKKEANNDLLGYVESLEEKKDNLLVEKSAYEKRNKKKVFFKSKKVSS